MQGGEDERCLRRGAKRRGLIEQIAVAAGGYSVGFCEGVDETDMWQAQRVWALLS